jgi:hypothetical protein
MSAPGYPFKVGDLALCINDSGRSGFLTENTIYRVLRTLNLTPRQVNVELETLHGKRIPDSHRRDRFVKP